MAQTSAAQNTLVIQIDDAFAHAFLFTTQGEQIILKDSQTQVITQGKKDIIQAFKYNFRERADEVEVVGDRKKWFADSLSSFSRKGLTVGVFLDSATTIFGHSRYGQSQQVNVDHFGWGSGLDDLVSNTRVDKLRAWLQINALGQEANKLLDYLGTKNIYPHLFHTGPTYQTAFVGLIRLLLEELRFEEMIKFERQDYLSKETRRRVLLTGPPFRQLSNYGLLLLAVIDAFQLEGVWEVVVDTQNVVMATAFSTEETVRYFEGLDLRQLGSSVILSHDYSWGKDLGEVEMDLGLAENQLLPLRSGELVRVPMEKEQAGKLMLNVKGEVDVLGHAGLKRLYGGELGLLVDARGRPLPRLTEVEKLREKFSHWLEAVRT